jgi:hypothetical protein
MNMTNNRKTLEEQLAEARAKKEHAAARLDQLEARRKIRDARMRAWGEKVLVGIMLNAATARIDVKGMLESVVANAELKPKEREAALWVLGSVERAAAVALNGVPALPAGNGPAADHAG